MSPRARGLVAGLFLLILVAGHVVTSTAAQAAPATYYVDCVGGSDANAGTSTASAWRSITKANAAPLVPGGQLLLKRGCTWNGTRLNVKWNATASARIVVGAYGSGTLPRIRNGQNSNVLITGSYTTVQDIEVSSDLPVQTVGGCSQPVANVYGFAIRKSSSSEQGHHNILQRVVARSMTAGVHISTQASANVITKSSFIGNNAMERFWSADPGSDLGAWGVLLNGSDNEVSWNTFDSNTAVCSNQGAPKHSNTVEIYQGSRNSIHHNQSKNERVFTELGGSATLKSADNTFAYNLMTSAQPSARFIVTRGDKSGWGPVWRSKVFRNTVVLTGPNSDAIVCGAGCTNQILTLEGNIIHSSNKVLYSDGPFAEGYNVFWAANGTPFFQAPQTMSPTSKMVDPKFMNPSGGDYRVQSVSPALDNGRSVYGFATDLVLLPSSTGSAADLGAYERPASATSSTSSTACAGSWSTCLPPRSAS